MVVAGHVWTPDGRCVCGNRLSDISFVAFDPYWVGKSDIAHSGSLNLAEQVEIAAAVDRLYGATRDAGV
jgi:hypothetical protein